MLRIGGSPHAIAAGFASGAAASMTPLIGFHFIAAITIAWATRGSLIVGAIGTVVGNPWTFPFIWATIFTVGRWILGVDGRETAPVELSFDALFEDFWSLIVPMLVGSIPVGVVTWVLFYFPMRRAAAAFYEQRKRKAAARGATPPDDAAPVA